MLLVGITVKLCTQISKATDTNTTRATNTTGLTAQPKKRRLSKHIRPSFKQYEDSHCIYLECLNCGTVTPFSNLRATSEQIEKAKREHVCKQIASALAVAA